MCVFKDIKTTHNLRRNILMTPASASPLTDWLFQAKSLEECSDNSRRANSLAWCSIKCLCGKILPLQQQVLDDEHSPRSAQQLLNTHYFAESIKLTNIMDAWGEPCRDCFSTQCHMCRAFSFWQHNTQHFKPTETQSLLSARWAVKCILFIMGLCKLSIVWKIIWALSFVLF